MCDSISCTPKTIISTRRRFLRTTGGTAIAAALAGVLPNRAAVAADDKASAPKPQNAVSPDDAIKRLMEGNARYVAGVTRRHDFVHEREALRGGQNPFAAVLGCADSRIAPEYAFDSARGDLFVTRVAGNFVNDDVLGSLEYAVAVLTIPAILVLGHDQCGAVEAAVKVVTQGATYPGKIQSLAESLVPAVDKVKHRDAPHLLDAAIVQNVRDSMAGLRAHSSIIRNASEAGTLKIVGGVYRLASGKVESVV